MLRDCQRNNKKTNNFASSDPHQWGGDHGKLERPGKRRIKGHRGDLGIELSGALGITGHQIDLRIELSGMGGKKVITGNRGDLGIELSGINGKRKQSDTNPF